MAKFFLQMKDTINVSLFNFHDIRIGHDFELAILLAAVASALFAAVIPGPQITQAVQLTESFDIALFLFIHYLSAVIYFFRRSAPSVPCYFTFNYGDSLLARRCTKAWTSLPRRWPRQKERRRRIICWTSWIRWPTSP